MRQAGGAGHWLIDRLVDQGNSVVVIDHNQPAPAKAGVIKTADWILDLGPDGGVRGGELVAEGTQAEPKTKRKTKAPA